MRTTKRTQAGEALTNLILDLFRLNSLLLTEGDRLVAGLGLTSARWQILGAIVIHTLNILCSYVFGTDVEGDSNPCVWYVNAFWNL